MALPRNSISPVRLANRLAWTATIGLFVALALFGAAVHWVEEAGTAERDGYVAQAEQVLSGQLPHDPFRPLLYPFLTAGLSTVVGAPFAAARLISNAAAALLAWLAWKTGRDLVGVRCGAWAFALVAVNPNLWILGQHASTDMLFAALGAGVLAALVSVVERPTANSSIAVLIAGLLFGLAAFTRGNALFLFPGIVLGFLLAPIPGATRLRWLALFAIAALPGFAAHWTTRALEFGSPFYDENWKNLAWKLYGAGDWSYLDRVPFQSASEIVHADLMRVLQGGGSEVLRFAKSGFAQIAGTWVHALTFGFGVAAAVWHRHRGALWLLTSIAMFTIALALAFFTWGRLLLALLPTIAAISAYPLATAWGGDRARRFGTLVAVALVLLLATKTFLFRLPAFGARHPYEEIAALRAVEDSAHPLSALAGTSPFLGRYLDRRYVALPDAFGPEKSNPALWFHRIAILLEQENVEFVAVSEIDLRDRPSALLGTTPPMPWLERVSTPNDSAPRPGSRVVVWRVRQEPRKTP